MPTVVRTNLMPEKPHDPPKTESNGEATTSAREIAVVLRDTVCGLAFFLLACLLAGLLDHLTPFDYPNLYIIWFAIGMIPLGLFLHWRSALTFTWRAVLGFAPLLLIFPFVPVTVFDRPVIWMFVVPAVVGTSCLVNWLLRITVREDPDSSSRTT